MFLSLYQTSEESYVLPCLADVNCGFLSFGSGKRACVGQKFAVLGISTLLASWIQEFQVRGLNPCGQFPFFFLFVDLVFFTECNRPSLLYLRALTI